MYRLATSLATILILASGLRVFAQIQTTLTYSTSYDNTFPLNQLPCSGVLETNNITTLGSLSAYPFVGGVYTLSGVNSPQCGACYAVTYDNKTVNILAVDASQTGFTVTQEAMDALTYNKSTVLGSVGVTFATVPPSACLPSSQGNGTATAKRGI